MTTKQALDRLIAKMGTRSIFVEEKSCIVTGTHGHEPSTKCKISWTPKGGSTLSMSVEKTGLNCVEDAYYQATDIFQSRPDVAPVPSQFDPSDPF